MKIVCLLENTSRIAEIESEHGLSLYIDTGTRKILFDMGQSSLFYDNAIKLGVDLAQVDIAVLSHGHNDHGGGLATFLKVNSRAQIYVSDSAFAPHYNAKGDYIGLDVSLQNNSRFIYVDNKMKIDTGLTVFNCNDLLPIVPINNCGHTAARDGCRVDEDYSHEQYLLIEEGEKRVLFSGCSHKGIINIMEWIKPSHLIGGFHFSKFPLDSSLDNLTKRLSSYNAEYYTCHCTGTAQFEFMKPYINSLNYLACGEEIIL